MITKAQLEREYGSDEALGVNERVVDTQTCWDYAECLMDRVDESAYVVHLPDENAGEAAGGGAHQFVVVYNRFIVDPWVVEWSHHALGRYHPTASRAVYDLHDPEDRPEIFRLYGHPGTWATDDESPAPLALPAHWEV